MKARFLPAGYSLRKVTEVDWLIADYIVNSSDEEIEPDTIWLHEEIRECWTSPSEDERAECYLIIDPNGNTVGYAELYERFEENTVIAL